MKLTHWVVFIIACLFISSCSVLFKRPQPSWVKVNETAFPPDMYGYYTATIDSGEHDTILITSSGISKSHQIEDLSLSDSVILRKYNDRFFLNVKDKRHKAWEVIIADKELQGFSISLLWADSASIVRLKSVVAVKETHKGRKRFIIDPNREQFNKIVAQNFLQPYAKYHRISPPAKK